MGPASLEAQLEETVILKTDAVPRKPAKADFSQDTGSESSRSKNLGSTDARCFRNDTRHI